MKDEKKTMTNNQTKALLKAAEIVIRTSKTKRQALKRLKEIARELGKEPIDTVQGKR